MPVQASGQLRDFTAAEILAMQIENADVRFGAHPTESRRVSENTMRRAFFVKWSERFNFAELVCGNSALWDDAGTTRLSRQLPSDPWGRHPSRRSIVATQILDMRGHGTCNEDGDRMPEYPKAYIEVGYEQADYKLVTDAAIGDERDRFVTPAQQSTGDVEPIGPFAGGIMKYVTATGLGAHGKPVPFGFSVMRSIERFTTTWRFLPYALVANGGALWNRLQFGEKVVGVPDGISYKGAVNGSDLVLAGIERTWGAERLLLEKVETELIRSQLAESDALGWKAHVTFHWAYAPDGWLNLLHFDPAVPANRGWVQVAADGNFYAVGTMPRDTGVYNLRNMNLLFSANW